MNKGTILFGYDVEVCDPKRAEVTRAFLRAADRVHRETGTGCTMFVCGMTLENSPDEFRALAQDPRYEFQAHMYAHSLIRDDVQWREGQHIGDPNRGQVTILRAASPAQVRAEVIRTRELLAGILGVESIGLRAPTGSYMGLLHRPELLDLLWEEGIRYVSSYHLHAEDFAHWKMAPIEPRGIIQPFWYSQVRQERGYRLEPGAPELPPTLPAIAEFPLLGAALDCTWKDIYGYDAYEEYLNALKVIIDALAREDLTLSYVQHDWSSIKGDPGMETTRAIIQYAQKKGVEVMTHGAYYQRMLAQKQD